MIDYENEIFTAVATRVRSDHVGTTVKGEYIRTPAQFPMIALSEYENVDVLRLIDSSQEEKYAGVGYRLQVFSNKEGGKKSEAKAIFKTADEVIRGMGLKRIAYSTTPEIYNSTIFSITATYEGIIDVDGMIYRRT